MNYYEGRSLTFHLNNVVVMIIERFPRDKHGVRRHQDENFSKKYDLALYCTYNMIFVKAGFKGRTRTL